MMWRIKPPPRLERKILRRSLCIPLTTELPQPCLLIETDALTIHSLPVTPMAMNQYLLGCKRQKKAALIDCGCDRPERWVKAAAQVFKICCLYSTAIFTPSSNKIKCVGVLNRVA
jgi:hypothetical protein